MPTLLSWEKMLQCSQIALLPSLDSATAMAVPTVALFLTSRMFISSDAPPVSSLILPSRYGVISLPVSRFRSASFSACSTAASTRAPCAVASSGIGTPAHDIHAADSTPAA